MRTNKFSRVQEVLSMLNNVIRESNTLLGNGVKQLKDLHKTIKDKDEKDSLSNAIDALEAFEENLHEAIDELESIEED